MREPVSDSERLNAMLVAQQFHRPGPIGHPHASLKTERVKYLSQRFPDIQVGEWMLRKRTGSRNLYGHVAVCRKGNHVG